MEMMGYDIMGIVHGVVAGVLYTLSGWFRKPGQKWDWTKVGPTILLGGVAGFMMHTKGMKLDVAVADASVLGIVAFAQNSLKGLFRAFK